ncbi:MAG: pyrroline-5-carboxylate reductase [Burkholderiaceae bacterium]
MTPPATALPILFIGGGNMAQAIVTGMRQANASTTDYDITIVEPDEACRTALAQKWGGAIRLCASMADAQSTTAAPSGSLHPDPMQAPRWVVLAVKPQQAREALAPVREAALFWRTSPTLLSVAAGVTVASLTRWSGIEAIVRTMPNTPAMVQQGVTGAYAVPRLSEVSRREADTMLRRLGAVVWVEDEQRLDAVTALSGSGPAYVFYFLEAFAAAGESLGLAKRDSETLALQTLKGALALLAQTGETPEGLRAKVTSKGGTTAAALAVLEAHPGLMGLMRQALSAAHQRAQEMAKDYAA